MISVLTPSIRPEGLRVVQQVLERQTYQDFEWLVEIGMPARGFTLPADYNRMLRRAKGDIIVSLQDYIHIPQTALAYIAQLDFEKAAYTFPVGKYESEGAIPEYDWRKDRAVDLIQPEEWEIDFAAAPRELFFDIGGFDERFLGWGMDNYEVAARAAAAGYFFRLSKGTLGMAYDHDKHEKHPFRNTLPRNDELALAAAKRAAAGDYRLPYLSIGGDNVGTKA